MIAAGVTGQVIYPSGGGGVKFAWGKNTENFQFW